MRAPSAPLVEPRRCGRDYFSGGTMASEAFRSMLRRMVEGESPLPVTLVLISLHSINRIHQTHGYLVAEEIATLMEERLSATRCVGWPTARFTTQAFVMAIPDERAPMPVALEIVDMLRGPFTVRGEEFFLRPAVGLASAPGDAATVDTLLQKAENAAACAQARHVEICVADDAYHQNVRRTHDLERDLHRGLIRGEFELHYQPIISLRSGRVTAAEALVRWRHPQRGLLAPEDFLDVASETGLLIPLGYWTIQQACRDAAAWQEGGLAGVRVAVNLSPHQLADAGLEHQLRVACAVSGFPPALLEVEITEDASVHLAQGNIFESLCALGMQITIDDFGTGYAAIANVSKLPAGRLKIDKSFTARVTRSSRDAAIVRGIIAIGREIGVTIVAEGVEDVQQLEFLRKAGCDEIQGWLVSYPLPVGDLPARARSLGDSISDVGRTWWRRRHVR